MKKNKQKGLLQKFWKCDPIIIMAWIIIKTFSPLPLLRITAIQKYLLALIYELPFNISDIG